MTTLIKIILGICILITVVEILLAIFWKEPKAIIGVAVGIVAVMMSAYALGMVM